MTDDDELRQRISDTLRLGQVDPANLKPRTPQESLAMLIFILTGLAKRGRTATNGLRITQTPDERGITIRIDLPVAH